MTITKFIRLIFRKVTAAYSKGGYTLPSRACNVTAYEAFVNRLPRTVGELSFSSGFGRDVFSRGCGCRKFRGFNNG
jgi:hypothetical protein